MYIPLTFEGALQKCLFASGGYEGYFISGSQQYKYHWFTGSAELTVQKGTIDKVEILVVGGGGGGAGATTNVGTAGGGGGGGVIYQTNQRLFSGTYYVTVGRGGGGAGAANNPGDSGLLSRFRGINMDITANGGQGGNYGSGNSGGTSGNGFAGGVNQSGNSGGGGGATSIGVSATSIKAGDGGSGVSVNVANYTYSFGCGGGGYAPNTSDTQGFSCNGSTGYGEGGEGNNLPGDGADRYGQGGGGGGPIGGNGGTGSVVIQYPIYDYCGNYFNETGSCGCVEVVFDVDNTGGYYPDVTGSYLYMPCGKNTYVSGSLLGYAPLTQCVVSGSYYSYDWYAPVTNTLTVRTGFATSQWVNPAAQCASQSLSPTTCSVEWFVPTCTSSIVTIYTPSGSGANQNDFYYVAKNATSHSVYSSTSQRVNYVCISTGSLYNGINLYPQVLTGASASLYNTASCNTITLVADWAGKSPSVISQTSYYFYNCNGEKTSVTFSRPSSNFTGALSASFCRDMITPTYFVRTGTSTPTEYLYTGSNCLSSYFDTGSCGCP